MKKIFIMLAAIVSMVCINAQTPEKMSYQAVIRNSSNALITNTSVGIQISILEGTQTGAAVYTETQTPTTNANGLVTLEIGNGTVVSGNFTNIDWANGIYFIKTETDPEGGTNYTISGTSQLLSVPYALHAKTAANAFSGDYNDLSNTPTTISTEQADAIAGIAKTIQDSANQIRAKIPDVSMLVAQNALRDTATSIRSSLFSGDYNDLSNAPTTITTEQSDAIIANIQAIKDSASQVRAAIPSISSLATQAALEDSASKIRSAMFSGDYNNLSNKPSNVSSFINDAGYLTSIDESSLSGALQDIKNVLVKGNDAGGDTLLNLNNLTIGSSTATASAAIEINSTQSALVISRMTTEQRDALTPLNGMMIYNTTKDKFQGCYTVPATEPTTIASSFVGGGSTSLSSRYDYNTYPYQTFKVSKDCKIDSLAFWVSQISPNYIPTLNIQVYASKPDTRPYGNAIATEQITVSELGRKAIKFSTPVALTAGTDYFFIISSTMNIDMPYGSVSLEKNSSSVLGDYDGGQLWQYLMSNVMDPMTMMPMFTTSTTPLSNDDLKFQLIDLGDPQSYKWVDYSVNSDIEELSVGIDNAATNAYVNGLEAKMQALQTTLAHIGLVANDIDGNSYGIVTIGTQTWMSENLKTTKLNDGTPIPSVVPNLTWVNLNTPGYAWYDNDSVTYGNVYGALYNWYTVNTGKLCPTGWHVPSDAEWTTLTTFLGGEAIAAPKLKESGTSHWNTPNTGATNEHNFNALPGGTRYYHGPYADINMTGMWWTSTWQSTYSAYYRYMGYNRDDVYRYYNSHKQGMSVRCIKN